HARNDRSEQIPPERDDDWRITRAKLLDHRIHHAAQEHTRERHDDGREEVSLRGLSEGRRAHATIHHGKAQAATWLAIWDRMGAGVILGRSEGGAEDLALPRIEPDDDELTLTFATCLPTPHLTSPLRGEEPCGSDLLDLDHRPTIASG